MATEVCAWHAEDKWREISSRTLHMLLSGLQGHMQEEKEHPFHIFYLPFEC